MSTWRIGVKELEETEDVEDEDSPEESRLARKVASFGMAVGRYYTPGRRKSEEESQGFTGINPGKSRRTNPGPALAKPARTGHPRV
jgi:hypothetical protein